MMTMQVILHESRELEFSVAKGAGVGVVAGVESLVDEFEVSDEAVGEVEAASADGAEVAVGRLRRRRFRRVIFRLRRLQNALPLPFLRFFAGGKLYQMDAVMSAGAKK